MNATINANTSTTETQTQFPRLSRWLDMFDEIRSTETPAPTEK